MGITGTETSNLPFKPPGVELLGQMGQSCDLGFTSEEVGVHIVTEKGSPGAGQGVRST